MNKILSIVGARPNFIKLAAIENLLHKHFTHKVIHTGQHYDYEMSQAFFDQLDIRKPDYNLSIKQKNSSIQLARMIKDISKIIAVERPNMVIVYGDTNSSLAGALVSSKSKVPLAHIEAGVRCNDRTVPEEINRIIIDNISNLLFCPTLKAVQNLKNEHNPAPSIFSGDIMYDLFLKNKMKIKTVKSSEKYIYCSMHRQENTEKPNKTDNILQQLDRVKMRVIMPLHPRTKKVLGPRIFKYKNIKFQAPFNYLDNLTAINNSVMVVTDSGGVQKEAYWLKKPCFTIRSSTEWPETVETGWNKIVKKENQLAININNFRKPNTHPKFFGNGSSADIINGHILRYLHG